MSAFEYRTISENGIDIREFSNAPITMTPWERANGFRVERRLIGDWQPVPEPDVSEQTSPSDSGTS